MHKRILNKRFVLRSVAASIAGIFLSRVVITPLMHVWGDPRWFRLTIIVTLFGVFAGMFALATSRRFAVRRRNDAEF